MTTPFSGNKHPQFNPAGTVETNATRTALDSLVAKLPELRPRFLQWEETYHGEMRQKPSQADTNLARSKGELFRIGGNSFEIYETLGSGDEGIIYSCQSTSETRTIKEFHPSADIDRYIKSYKQFLQRNVPMPAICEISQDSRIISFQHVIAVPINYLGFHCNDLLSLEEVLSWKAEVNKFCRTYPGAHDHQLIMELGTGKLFCVDPL